MTAAPAVRRLPLAAEDLALAAWNAAAVPLIGVSAAAPLLALAEGPNPLAGWVQLLAVIGAIVAVATRPSGLPRDAPVAATRMLIVGPLSAAIAFVAGSAATYLGWAIDGPITGIAFLAIVAAMTFGDRLPVVDAGLRRLLLVPFILVCAGVFDGFAAELLTDLDVIGLIGQVAVDDTGFGLFVLTMLVGGLAAFYAALVVAPRVLIGVEELGGCLAWPLRFVLFLASAAFGIGWLTVLAG